MRLLREVYTNRWNRSRSLALIGLAIPTTFTYLWKAQYIRPLSTASLVSLGSVTLCCLLGASRRTRKINAKDVIVITGCDSGLGYSLALYCRSLGSTVIAGVLELAGKGAENLSQSGVDVRHLDVTDYRSIEQFGKQVRSVLNEQDLVLRALVNNAGIMIFGEFEWQTAEQMQQQVVVNLLGTMRMTRELMPTIRSDKSRIIMVSSHCAMESIPGLSIYGATKAAILAWSTSLRVELNKYGVKVVSFIPGNFVAESNIMTRQKQYFDVMEQSMSQEAKNFYGDYFTRYVQKFSLAPLLSYKIDPIPITNPNVYETFNNALLDVYPSTVYKCEPWRYFFYYSLFKKVPTWIRDPLMCKFIQTPSWTR